MKRLLCAVLAVLGVIGALWAFQSTKPVCRVDCPRPTATMAAQVVVIEQLQEESTDGSFWDTFGSYDATSGTLKLTWLGTFVLGLAALVLLVVAFMFVV